ncbi:MAG: hypothetical protein AAFW47_06745 [Pseudomonadota bacterium]
MKNVSTTARLSVVSFFVFGAMITGAGAASEGRERGFHPASGPRILTKFVEMDKNNDNQISLEEFLGNANERFTKTDVDADGKLTRLEVRTAVETRIKERMAARGKDVSDASGKPARKVERMSARITERMFEKLDLNDDDNITGEERDTVLSKRFALADRNDDKQVDTREIERAAHLILGRKGRHGSRGPGKWRD